MRISPARAPSNKCAHRETHTRLGPKIAQCPLGITISTKVDRMSVWRSKIKVKSSAFYLTMEMLVYWRHSEFSSLRQDAIEYHWTISPANIITGWNLETLSAHHTSPGDALYRMATTQTLEPWDLLGTRTTSENALEGGDFHFELNRPCLHGRVTGLECFILIVVKKRKEDTNARPSCIQLMCTPWNPLSPRSRKHSIPLTL